MSEYVKPPGSFHETLQHLMDQMAQDIRQMEQAEAAGGVCSAKAANLPTPQATSGLSVEHCERALLVLGGRRPSLPS